MAMRITTKMMQNRSLNNLNTNKTLQEKLTTQLSTMKKITRPSDDPQPERAPRSFYDRPLW
jgi:flagellar hook-associated protein 3 FlgL